MQKPKIAISIGDINGIGIEIAIRSHELINTFCKPYYFIHTSLLDEALQKLELKKPKHFHTISFEHAQKTAFQKHSQYAVFKANLKCEVDANFHIQAGQIDAKSGAYSFASFKAACTFVKLGFAQALVTLPIHKKAWSEAGLTYRGHTEALRDFFKQEAMMMLGNSKLFVALFTEHIPLNEVSSYIQIPKLCEFLITFYEQTHFKNIGILAFNPHASDFGTIGGEEERKITKAIKLANIFLSLKDTSKLVKKDILRTYKLTKANVLDQLLNDEKLALKIQNDIVLKHFYLPNPLVADTAFTPNALKHCNRLVSMFHDLALAPLKALYFDKSVNISLNLPIIRTSVDHGTAFDKAYKNVKISTKSYKEAVKMALHFVKVKSKS